MSTRVLITGALGQLGLALAQVLSSGMDLLLTDLEPGDSGVAPCDITSWEQVKEAVRSFKPQYIVNSAAMTDVDGNEREPERARLVNTVGVEHLLAAGAEAGARLVQVSTDYVFDGTAGPYLESDKPAPLSVYGRTKLEAERLVLEGDAHLVIRANVLFGPDIESRASFVHWVVNSLEEGKQIRVVDDQINNPTLTTNLAEAIRKALEQGAGGLYHYGGLEFASRYDFALKIAQHFNLPVEGIATITTKELDQLAPRPLKGGLICSKMKMELNVTNSNISEGLSQAFPVS
ncbi:MAG: dTDP-4-dehydrorhamnose reductase [Fidelibacterota bacterium]|nr:MAG: dTDP-4-dehydrorhamnose reductase [Candidatus Neomarinimicrobiota bacterium]